MKEAELYKNRVIQAVYNKMQALRDSSLANITAILETPCVAASDELEGEMDNLLRANMNLSQLENMFSTTEKEECCGDKESCDTE